jgi:hypothetical protein
MKQKLISAESLKDRLNAQHPGWYGLMQVTAVIDDEPSIDPLKDLEDWIEQNFGAADYDAGLILKHIRQMKAAS